MTTVYIREQGAVVHKRGERLVVTKGEATLLDQPLVHVEQLALVGNIQLTTQAVAVLLQREVDVVFFSSAFRYRGRLMATGSKFAELRHAQLRAMSDEATTLRLAKSVVDGKLANQAWLLRRRAGGSASASSSATASGVEPGVRSMLEAAAQGVDGMRDAAAHASNLDSLRGYEGKAGAYYFGGVKLLLDPAWGFQGRQYYPPPDPVNAALSFGYALLLKDTIAAVQLVGLDPYLGFFHVIDYGRASLALDLMEEFRPLVVDRLVLRLVAQRHLGSADFARTGQSKRPVSLTTGATDTMLMAYESEMAKRVHHPGSGQSNTYRRCIELQARQLAAVVLGRADRFVPMTARPAVGRDRSGTG